MGAGSLGVSPSFKKSPHDWGIRGLIESISAVSINRAIAELTQPPFISIVMYEDLTAYMTQRKGSLLCMRLIHYR
jgi:hypothetical protein